VHAGQYWNARYFCIYECAGNRNSCRFSAMRRQASLGAHGKFIVRDRQFRALVADSSFSQLFKVSLGDGTVSVSVL
jgi:hypothetical protein